MKITSKAIFKTKSLIRLAVTCLAIALPAGAIAAQDKKVWDDSAVAQVKDTLRQISEAATLWEKAGECKGSDCTIIGKLVAAGKLAEAPRVPPGIGVAADTHMYYQETDRRMGGCGKGSPGSPQTTNLSLESVSEQFCRDYNKSVGLGGIIVPNCATGGDCTASSSTSSYDFPEVTSHTFCYNRDNTFTVVWMTTISTSACPK